MFANTEHSLIIFAIASLVIAAAGTRMTKLADEIADVTGLGEAVIGAILLGACTSLSGSVTSVTAAWQGNAELAVSNGIGGIAAQTLFLAIADMTYRKANLEHVAASQENLAQSTLLMGLLSLPLLATFAPEVTFWHIHPMSPFMLGAYAFGIFQLTQMRSMPMWKPHLTPDTQREDEEHQPATQTLARMLGEFAVLALTVGFAGYAIADVAPDIASRFGLSQTLIGSLFTAISTSLPELITVLAAVRRGAYTLAVGDIIGGNTFDVLFLAFSDFAFLEGSIFHTMNDQQLFIIALTMAMTSILLLGLLRRERHGVYGIGFESLSILLLYGFGMAVIFMVG
jgi:cation:H+ antiporter